MKEIMEIEQKMCGMDYIMLSITWLFGVVCAAISIDCVKPLYFLCLVLCIMLVGADWLAGTIKLKQKRLVDTSGRFMSGDESRLWVIWRMKYIQDSILRATRLLVSFGAGLLFSSYVDIFMWLFAKF